METRKHSLTLAGHRTSVSLEPDFWQAFQQIAERRGVSLNALAEEIDALRLEESADGANLSSAIRLYVLHDLQSRLSQSPDS